MHVYDILKRPVVTEKSNAQGDDSNQYTFEVDQRANKMQVKDAVETAFNVKVAGRAASSTSRPRWAATAASIVTKKPALEEGGGDAGAGQHDPVLRRV